MTQTQLLEAWWRVLLRLRVIWVSQRFRCDGSQPALCWMDLPDGGYYRGGILRQYCLLFKGHKGLCLSTIDEWGRTTRKGAGFKPELKEW